MLPLPNVAFTHRGSDWETAMSEPEHHGQSPAAEISTGTVQLLHEYTGRGPTKAKTTIGEATVTVLLAETLTKMEHRLAELGYEDTVKTIRAQFQEAMRDDLVELVEAETEREVVAFISGYHIGPDFEADVFVLAPAQAD